MNKSKTILNDFKTFNEHVMNKTEKIVNGRVINKSWTGCKKVMNKPGTSFEEVRNKS